MHSKKMNTSADAIASLSEQVYCMLDAAAERTKANGRKTVKPQDI
jgi:histone H3/H4